MKGGEMQLPPGFRFHPTDEELVTHYLCRKCAGLPLAVAIIAEIDLYKHDPWHLPGMALYGEREWYFFSPRDRKYPNGSRPNRAARSGYWKATGADKPIGSPMPVAIKKALVFYSGKAPRGEKTNWIMHEYRLADVDRSVRRKTHSLRLDDWVLCRIYNKKGGPERKAAGARRAWAREEKPRIIGPHVPVATSELLCFEPSESLPRLHADSSGSEFTCESREVESEPRWEKALQVADNNGDAPAGFGLPPLSPAGFRDPLHDIFMYLQKPF